METKKEKGKVLVIEDLPKWQGILSKALIKANFYVDIVDNLEAALRKIEKERFHFITIDMNLSDEATKPFIASEMEGWDILEIVNKLRVHETTPTMVITAFEDEYQMEKRLKGIEAMFFMSKLDYDPQKMISKIEEMVKTFDLRFYNDHRDS